MYSNQQSVQHGGNGGEPHEFTLDPGERLWGISGRRGDRIDQIKLHTDRKEIGPFPSVASGGEPFFIGDENEEIIGIYGRSGRELDAIGAVLRRLPAV
jgi:hypothetical protein